MAKGIIKEIIIVLLLILAILLILGVILYEYVPANKQLPEAVTYVTPQNVKEKLGSIQGIDEDQVILTYELNQTDLYNYQRINEYKPGKTNPFSSYEKETPQEGDNTENTGNNGSSSSGNSSSGGTSTNTSSSSSGSSSGTAGNSGSTPYTAPTNQGGVNPGNYSNKSGTK